MKYLQFLPGIIVFGGMLTIFIIQHNTDKKEDKKRYFMYQYFRCMRLRDEGIMNLKDTAQFNKYWDSTNYYFDQWRAVK